MAKGAEIIVTAEPQGKFLEGIILGTPVPGTCMEKVPNVASSNGRFSYRAITRATGTKGPTIVLLGDTLQGKMSVNLNNAIGDAYVSGSRGFMYEPIAGEDLNLAMANITGTADNVDIGDLLAIQQTTGLLVKNDANNYAALPFESNETIVDPQAEYVVWVTYLGNQA